MRMVGEISPKKLSAFLTGYKQLESRYVKKPGDINRNGQVLQRLTVERGSDHNSKVWILKCRNCLNIFGSNSTDAFERKCPNCQGGKNGLPIPIERDGEDWTHEEHLIAFQLYQRIPFGTIHMRNPLVIELAALLGRKVGSASRKLANFARFDPALLARGIQGLKRGAIGEKFVWEEFAHDPEAFAVRGEQLLADRLGQRIEDLAEIQINDLPSVGIEREALIKIRVNQSFFRRRILSDLIFVAALRVSPIEPYCLQATFYRGPKTRKTDSILKTAFV